MRVRGRGRVRVRVRGRGRARGRVSGKRAELELRRPHTEGLLALLAAALAVGFAGCNQAGCPG